MKKQRQDSNSRLVYSTDGGRVKETASAKAAPTGDGIVRIRRETSGRKGKGVITIGGLPLAAAELKLLAAELKKLCGCGGAVKDGVIEIQGDKRDLIKTALEQRGFTVKLAGG